MARTRWILPLLAALIAVAMGATLASADGGPHGGYTATTDDCAACHRAHTASGANLLRSASTYALCTGCHGVASGGANTDVQDGLYISLNQPLKGGGFGFATMNVAYTNTVPISTTVTSKHAVSGTLGYTADTMWGSGVLGDSTAGATVSLQCITCHNPHGRAAGGTATYRILRPIPNSAGGSSTISGTATIPVTITDATLPYVISDTVTSKYYGQQYPGVALETISDWCARCHTRVHAKSADNPADTNSGDLFYGFRHPTDGASVADNYGTSPNTWANTQVPGCLTCHVVHGSTATMGTYSNGILHPDGSAGQGGSMLRVNNRGVCELCHNK